MTNFFPDFVTTSFILKTECIIEVIRLRPDDQSLLNVTSNIKTNKVISTMVIRPLDDRTYIVLYLHSLIWGLRQKLYIAQAITKQKSNSKRDTIESNFNTSISWLVI